MRLLKPLLLSALVVAGLAGANAATPGDAKATPSVAKQPPVPLLWKVSDADNSVYLLGSFHLLRPTDYPLSGDVDAAFADAESLVFELPPEEMSSPSLGISMMKAALRADGSALSSELSPSTAKKLETWLTVNNDALTKARMPPEQLQRFEPWFTGLMVSLIEMGKYGLDQKLGLDAHFAAEAKKSGKATAGFETGEQQIAFLDGMSKDEQLQLLDEALTESEEGKHEVEKLHSAWRAGDAVVLWDEMATDMRKQYPKLYKRINVERNDAWLPQLERRLKESTSDDTLVVVGTLHLLGSDGVVEKLRAKGYKVERVCSACKPVKKR